MGERKVTILGRTGLFGPRKGKEAEVTKYLYLSLVPEALIASELPPEKFGQYYATGYAYKSKGQALFFEVDPEFRHEFFQIDEALELCVPGPDGHPKDSVYVSTYRVVEHVPPSALGQLYLTTAYGATLGIARSTKPLPPADGLHLYQELAPVTSIVASSLDPQAFYEAITVDPPKLIRFPALCFVELEIGELATDPEGGRLEDLPYKNPYHLREVLVEVAQPGKLIKLAERVQSASFPYRMVKTGSGFYYGQGAELAFYPMPTHSQLREANPLWWRSANQ